MRKRARQLSLRKRLPIYNRGVFCGALDKQALVFTRGFSEKPSSTYGNHTMKEGSKVPRRGNVPKREVLPDPIYNSVLVTKLVNSIMLDGKKGVAQKVAHCADIIKGEDREGPLDVFTTALENIMPSLRSRPAAWAAPPTRCPIEVRPERRQTLGLRWLTNYPRARSEKTMKERLAGEIMDAANNLGSAVKKREDTQHKMAESNKAFAHYRW